MHLEMCYFYLSAFGVLKLSAPRCSQELTGLGKMAHFMENPELSPLLLEWSTEAARVNMGVPGEKKSPIPSARSPPCACVGTHTHTHTHTHSLLTSPSSLPCASFPRRPSEAGLGGMRGSRRPLCRRLLIPEAVDTDGSEPSP